MVLGGEAEFWGYARQRGCRGEPLLVVWGLAPQSCSIIAFSLMVKVFS